MVRTYFFSTKGLGLLSVILSLTRVLRFRESYFTPIYKNRLSGRKASPFMEMDSPLIFKYRFVEISFSSANDAPPQVD
ncbi:hypothetical protein [Saccharolobus shibatae]|uniref:hypothetical protein n=1 Tax=Saccharolobus shibatae TaxID=2286 RepID=UPI001C46F4E4|nr:hypothetical protein [Saccharolobus shibatae]